LIEKQTKKSGNSINFTLQLKKKAKKFTLIGQKILLLQKKPFFAQNPQKTVFGQKEVKILTSKKISH